MVAFHAIKQLLEQLGVPGACSQGLDSLVPLLESLPFAAT
jgi:hypothetical protein